jgi:histidine triad (HIT) family protein
MLRKNKVLVFGTFDHIHPGHKFFLNEAKKLGELYVSIASDQSIIKRKLKNPLKDERARVKDIASLKIAKSVSIGDKVLGQWSDIKRVEPNIVAIGYDQKELESKLKTIQKKFNFKIVKIKGFKSKQLHSSILNKNCVYCTIPEIKNRMIVENKYAWAFPTNIPIVPGHLLIAPKRCVTKFEDMNKSEMEAVFSLLRKLKTALTKTFDTSGFNIAWNDGELAGQSVPHFHLHVLPRKIGDKGITKYEPRKFLYRPGSREVTPEKELREVARLVKSNLK